MSQPSRSATAHGSITDHATAPHWNATSYHPCAGCSPPDHTSAFRARNPKNRPISSARIPSRNRALRTRSPAPARSLSSSTLRKPPSSLLLPSAGSQERLRADARATRPGVWEGRGYGSEFRSAGLRDDPVERGPVERLHRGGAHVPERPDLQEHSRRGLGVGSLRDDHEVVGAEGPVDRLDAPSALLDELREGVGPLPRISEVLHALVRPADEAHEGGHGSSLPRASTAPTRLPYARRNPVRNIRLSIRYSI